jgi:hypothetical protein
MAAQRLLMVGVLGRNISGCVMLHNLTLLG